MTVPSGRHSLVAASDLLVAIALLTGVWFALPARWWPIDLLGSGLAVLFGASGAALWWRAAWAERLARAAAAAGLAVGMTLATTLAWTASYLAGLYGPVGSGGALLLVLVAALILPYLVFLPAAQLWALGVGQRRTVAATSPSSSP